MPLLLTTQQSGRRLRSRWRGLAVLLAVGGLLPAVRAETLTLAACLQEVAEHNPAILSERSAVERATATRLTLRSRALPSLTVGGIVGDLIQEQDVAPVQTLNAAGKIVTTPAKVTSAQSFIFLATGTLYQSLFDAGIPASFRRGTVGVLAAEQNFYGVASTQLHAARLLFYQALYQQQEGELLHQSDQNLAGNVKSQEQLVAAGLAGRTALLSAQVQRANFGPGILSATGTYRTSLASLLQAMGRELSYQPGDDPLARITLAGTLDGAAIAFDPAEATRIALERRPDLLSLRALVKASQEDANIAKAGYYPLIRLYLAGEYIPQNNVRTQPNAVRATDQVDTTELRPGVSGNWLIIDPGTTRGAVHFQEAVRDIVAISLHRMETDLPAELATVHARLTAAAGRVAALTGNVAAAQDTLNIVQASVAQGISSQTEFLFAQNDLLAVRTGLLSARLEMSLAHAEFDRLTGNYLHYVEDAPASDTRRPAKK